eukprot:4391804-Amphidinium_carterae.1
MMNRPQPSFCHQGRKSYKSSAQTLPLCQEVKSQTEMRFPGFHPFPELPWNQVLGLALVDHLHKGLPMSYPEGNGASRVSLGRHGACQQVNTAHDHT